MKLLFKQRLFSWFDSYDIYNENGDTVFTVHGKPSWGHKLHIHDSSDNHIATVKQVLLTFMPRFELYVGDRYVGSISKKFTFLRPSYEIDFNNWRISGSFLEWDYRIEDVSQRCVAVISKEIFNFTDTYSIDVNNSNDALYVLMTVLAIDAEKCSRQ